MLEIDRISITSYYSRDAEDVYRYATRLFNLGDYQECSRICTQRIQDISDPQRCMLYELAVISYASLNGRSNQIDGQKCLDEFKDFLDKNCGKYSRHRAKYYSTKGEFLLLQQSYTIAYKALRTAYWIETLMSEDTHHCFVRLSKSLYLLRRFHSAYRYQRTSIVWAVRHYGWRSGAATKSTFITELLPKLISTLFQVGYVCEATILLSVFSSILHPKKKRLTAAPKHLRLLWELVEDYKLKEEHLNCTALDSTNEEFAVQVISMAKFGRSLSRSAFRAKMNLYSTLIAHPQTYQR